MPHEQTWTIRPLCFGEFPTMERSGFTFAKNQGVRFSAPAIGFLLTSGDSTVLVDTGPADSAEHHHPSHTALSRTPEQTPTAALYAIGLDPADLDLIVLTHLHYDHSYNLGLFPNAEFVVQATELGAAVDPIAPQRAMYEIGITGLVPPWMTVTDQLKVVRGDTEIAPGLTVLHLPGHTPGMQGVLVQTAAGPHLLASDLVSTYENIGTGSDDRVLPGIHTDLVACERSLDRIAATGAVVVPSHDWAVFEHETYPAT